MTKFRIIFLTVVLSVGIVSITMSSIVLAQSILPTTDSVNFDSYTNGNLNGQDGWSDSWNSLLVQDEMMFAGSKALRNQTSFGAIGYKKLSDEFSEKGVISVKMRIDGNDFSDNQDVFGIYKGMNEESVALFRFGNNFNNRQDMLLLSIAESADVIDVGQITQGEWHKVSIAWRNSDFKIRIKVDNDDWSEWFSSQTTWNEGESLAMKVALPEANKYGNFYLDDIKSFIAYDEPEYDPILLIQKAEPLEISENSDEEIPPTTEVEIETDSSPTETVVDVDSGILDTIVDTIPDIIDEGDTTEEVIPTPETSTDSTVEESTPPSSVIGDENTNDTITTTF